MPFRTTTRFAICLLVVLSTAACGGASPSGAAPSSAPVPSSSNAASPPATAAIATSAPSPTAALPQDIIGTWTRTQSCKEELAAFEATGLAKAAGFEWVTANWVPGASPRSSGFCDGAIPPTTHSHFFTKDGGFGSRDANGEQVDDGDYAVSSPGVLDFTSHASDFGYTGQIVVRYTITGGQATFDVQVPSGCASDATCADAYGWALSAFFKGAPWTR
jgi:hypothetical protein